MSKALFNLVVELPGAPVRYYLLGAGIIRFGRGDKNGIIIEEDTVSSRHGELRRKEGGYEIIDLGSTNGTRLNGEPVGSEPRELHEGDILVFGHTVKARFVRVIEVCDKAAKNPVPPGSLTRKLERNTSPARPAINPVAAAVAKAARANAKQS